MKILVTGGTGYIGSALRRELRAQGHNVRLLVRATSAGRVDDAADYEIVTGDVLDTHACLRAVDGVDGVVNLIGIRREYPHDGTTYEALHTSATFDLVDAAKRFGVKRFVQMSGLGTRENAASRYHQTKWEAEEIVRGSGMRWTIFRPSVIFGPNDDFHPTLVDLALRPIVPLPNGGSALMQPVALHNVISAMTRSMTMPQTQGCTYEVGGPDRMAFIDIFEAVTQKLEIWPNTVNVPAFFMKPAVRMLQHLKGFPLTYEELLMLLEDNVCDSTAFLDAFGGTLDSYREALPEILEGLSIHAATA